MKKVFTILVSVSLFSTVVFAQRTPNRPGGSPLGPVIGPGSGAGSSIVNGAIDQTLSDFSNTRPLDSILFWDEFTGRNMESVTNLGTSPSGHYWHMLSLNATDATTMSNGFWRPHGADNSQNPYYGAISNSIFGYRYTRVGGKYHPLANPGGFALQGMGAIILTDQWPSFTADPNWTHITIYEHLWQIEVGPVIVFTFLYPNGTVPKNTPYIYDFQFASNTCWWAVGPYSGSFTHPLLYLGHSKIYNVWRGETTTTNVIVGQWDSVWAGYAESEKSKLTEPFYVRPGADAGTNALSTNAYVGGTIYKRVAVPALTNLNANIATFTNAMFDIIEANFLTNNLDGYKAEWSGRLLAGTNNFRFIIGQTSGSTTVLDTAGFTNAATRWHYWQEVTRTGPSTAHVNGLLTLNQLAPSQNTLDASVFVVNSDITLTHGIPHTNLLQMSSSALGGASNNWMSVSYIPGGR